jgi:hypothetical protein
MNQDSADLSRQGLGDERAALTAERAPVAAVVAAAFLAGAFSLSLDLPPGTTFEPGCATSPWVTTHRARMLWPWQPPRFTE